MHVVVIFLGATLAAFAVVAFFATWFVLVPLWDGFVLHLLWKWFAEPLGLPTLTLPYAIGALLLLMLLKRKRHSTKEDRDDKRTTTERLEELASDLGYSAWTSLLLLGFGFGVKLWWGLP